MLAEHQVEAVRRCLELLRRRGGAILADEVGLGKSFVAAEVMKEWAEVELIVPAALVGQWRELTDARVLTHDALARDAFVPRPGRPLVVVDEAHAFRNPRTQRYAALARRTAGARVLLVTATPVCNSAGDLEALLRLIAPDDLLRDRGVPSIDAAFAGRDREAIDVIVETLVIRRDRTVLPPELRFGDGTAGGATPRSGGVHHRRAAVSAGGWACRSAAVPLAAPGVERGGPGRIGAPAAAVLRSRAGEHRRRPGAAEA